MHRSRRQPDTRPAGFAARLACLGALVVFAQLAGVTGATQKFFSDDPIARDVDTEDASAVQPWEIDLVWDLSLNAFATPGRTEAPPRAGNVNTIDEVPDSNWFTNRILARPLGADAVARGPLAGTGPSAGRLTVVRPKQTGVAPGFTMRDASGDIWFVSFDARGYPEAASGAILVANKLFWALGYWQVENYLFTIRPDQVDIADSASLRTPGGDRRPMRRADLDAVFARAHRGSDGGYRAVAARAVPGTTIGGFRYHGTRPDDPNDIVPHEDRRELRALKVFGAWTNLVDMKAGNTLDTIVEENGRKVVRHYLQDVGSTFGVGALGPHDYDEGHEFLYEGDIMLKRMATLGLYLSPWQTIRYETVPAVGRFEGEAFDPIAWKPRVPTAAFLRARADDNFWAARRVAAFTDEQITAAARTAQYTDPRAAPQLARILIQRRDTIARAWLPAVNPLVDFSLSRAGVLAFVNAAQQAGVAPAPKGYAATWARFDNATGQTTPIGPETSGGPASLPAPAGLPAEDGAYIRVQVRAVDAPHASWHTPVDVYFRRAADGWTLVGLERQP